MHRVLNSSRCRAVMAAVLAAVLLISTIPFVTLPAKAVNVTSTAEFLTAVTAGNDITLTADITLDVGTAAAFSGTIDGNGHVIRLKGSRALFTDFSGEVSNLGVVAEGTVNDNGIFAQTVSGNGKITACFVYGDIHYTGETIAGGLIGDMTGGTVTESFSCVSIETTTASYVGGLIGKISGGSVSSCYSAGYIRVDNQKTLVGGFANLSDSDKDGEPDGKVSDTYTSCQLVNRSPNAMPSGVDGLYDNQLSVVRESAANAGLKTRALMSTTDLSDAFAVTSTTYPHLIAFDAAHWRHTAKDIIRVSVAAVAFSDVNPSKRIEPSSWAARADYLTPESYLDKTNEESFWWSVDKTDCKMYDTVPVTKNQTGSHQNASSADLLRSRLVFSSVTENAKLTVNNGGYTRVWFLSAYTANPYFAGYSEDTKEFLINNAATLDSVRYYSRIGATNYKVTESFPCGEWDAIEEFSGNFNGNNFTISDVAIKEDKADSYGLFASSQAGSKINNLALTGVIISTTDDEAVVGGLVGKATDTTISNVLVSVELSGNNGVGGLVGDMTNGSISACGVTGYVTGVSALGGLVGETNGTTMTDCYSTAAVFASDSTASTIGGLIGSMTGSLLSNSYVSALVDAPNGDAIVGVPSGATINNSYYDHDMTVQNVGDIGKTSAALATTAPSANWTVSAGHYPQLTVFTNTALKSLSALSTQRVFFQKYWNDAAANNMTTGWIAKSFISGAVFSEPTVIEAIDDTGAVVKSHKVSSTAGFMFEANSSSRLLALRAEDAVTGGIRVIAAARDDMITLAYTVTGVDDVNSYVDVYYSSDGGASWQGSQVMSQSKTDGTGDVHKLYDMPKDSIVKIRVRTLDDYAVDSIKIGSDELMVTDDGYYHCYVNGDEDKVLSEDTTVNIVLKDGEPEWGIRLETY